MRTVNLGRAKTELSRLVSLAEAGEDVEIARDGVPVVRLVPVSRKPPGVSFLAAVGSAAGEVAVGADFELTEAELDEIVGS